MLLIATVSISNGQINSNDTTEINCSGQVDCYNQGMELLSKGNCTEAYVALESAIKDSPSNADAWVGKGRVAACLGNFSEAIKCCDAALVWDSENAQAYVVKAQALISLNKSDEARAMMENAAEKNISNPLLWIELGPCVIG
jgi:tetratricopeptide (TPR) repeat protein